MIPRLEGHRVVVTRAPEDAHTVVRALESEGADALHLPTIVRAPPPDPAALRKAWAEVDRFDRVLVGSAAALAPFCDLPTPPARVPVACVGDRTARRLREDTRLAARFEVVEVARVERAEGLVEALLDALGRDGRLFARRFLLPRPPEGRTALIETLRRLDAEVHEILSYQIRCGPPVADPVRRKLDGATAYTFFSGQTLACFLEILGAEEAHARLKAATVAVIGPVAAARAHDLSVRVDVIPPRASAAALVEALADHLSGRGP